MVREAFAHWYVALPIALMLIVTKFPGDEGTVFFWQFVVGMAVAPFLCAAMVLAWRRYRKSAPRQERIVTHADGTRARVDGAGKGYRRVEAQPKRDDFLTWLGKRV